MLDLELLEQQTAELISDTERLERLIAHGRLEFNDDPETMRMIEETAEEVKRCRQAIAFAQAQIYRLS